MFLTASWTWVQVYSSEMSVEVLLLIVLWQEDTCSLSCPSFAMQMSPHIFIKGTFGAEVIIHEKSSRVYHTELVNRAAAISHIIMLLMMKMDF
jgi:hypothetical protein